MLGSADGAEQRHHCVQSLMLANGTIHLLQQLLRKALWAVFTLTPML